MGLLEKKEINKLLYDFIKKNMENLKQISGLNNRQSMCGYLKKMARL